jgi:NADPH:quinone reductase-like Zn-dependent oxidoreductase
MAFRQSCMPRFDPMQMTVSNKSVLAFNLSFFAEEKQLVSSLLDQIVQWLIARQLRCPTITEIGMDNIASAHDYLQSGKSIGKIVVRTGVD